MMLKKIKRGLILQLSFIILLALFFGGCGKKAPPRPPRKEKVPAANDLTPILHEEYKTKVIYASFYIPQQ